jgi:hypothetical protein
MNKYLFVCIIIIVFSGCQKREQPTNNEEYGSTEEMDIDSNLDSKNLSKENILISDSAYIMNIENFSLEDIIGSWWKSTPTKLIVIKYTNNGILHIMELDEFSGILIEDFYPYKIEDNNIVIEGANKRNDFGYDINEYVLATDIYISNLDIKELSLNNINTTGFPARFYKGSLEEILERRNVQINYENKLIEFINNEVLNGIVFQGSDNDENGVINTYGVPLKDETIEYSDGQRYEGGRLTGIREITYEDLTHRYYIFTRYAQYVDVILDKKLDRLKTINIGASSEKVLAAFGGNYWRKEGEDIIYMIGGDHSAEPWRWVKFTIEDNLVVIISYIITRW